jgi:hypothetical protein
VRNTSGQSAFYTPIQYSFEIPRQFNKTRGRIKMDPNKEGRRKSIPICNNVILFLRDTKNCTKIYLVEIINYFGKVARCKINIQQLFHTPKMQTEKQIRE